MMAAPLALAGGWTAYSRWMIDHSLPLGKAIDAEWRTFLGHSSGILTYYVDHHAAGRPLVLLHSINAAGSALEMRPLFDHYRHHRPVFALDLPGFGFSERSERTYSPPLYTDAILDLIEMEIGEPVDLVALSLSCEFAARAALQQPDRFHSLAFISPTGFTADNLSRAPDDQSTDRSRQAFYRLFSFPLWAQALYDLIVTRSSIHYFLQKSFVGPVDPNLEEYDYATSHQPGARYAPLAFISGQLFTRDVCPGIYEYLTMPVLVIYDRDPFVRFELLPEMLATHPHWSGARIIPTHGLPHFERLDDTVAALDRFWGEPGTG
jgi:pimeloyl-ACP methyl ester carboxylesterase